MNFISFALILISVFLTASAQLLLKLGMRDVGNVRASFDGMLDLFFKVSKNPYIYMGMSAFALSVFLWLIVLSKVDLSVAYPFVGVGCIFTAIMAFLFLGEPLTFMKISGICIVCLGIFLISRS